MASEVKMCLTWAFLFLSLICCPFNVIASEIEDLNLEVGKKVLQHLNQENDTKFRYQTATTIETHILNEVTYFLVDVATACKDAEDETCQPISLVCQGAEELGSVSTVKCFLKEEYPALPEYKQGFIVKRSNTFIEGVLEHGLQKLERDGGPKRRVIEIISVKKRETSGTEVFVTSKVAAGSEEGGDLLELEVCELVAVLGPPGSMQILDTETKCFPLVEDSETDHLGGTSVTSQQLIGLAHWALDKINVATNLVFNYSLVEVVKADASTTPGSGGLLTTLQMRVAPSACPKHPSVSASLGVEWQCAATGQPLVCTVSAWERPWRGDTLMSHPRCKRIPVHTTPAPQGSNTPVRQPGFCVGCLHEVDKLNPKVAEMAAAAVEQLNTGQLAASPHQLRGVLSAHKQVVNGVRYVLNVELVACLAEVVPCEVSGEAEVGLRCRLELLEGAVDHQRTLLSSLCQPLSQKDQSTLSEAVPVVETSSSEQQVTSETVEELATTTAVPEQVVEVQADPSASTTENSLGEERGQQEEEETVVYNGPHTTQRRAKRSNSLLGGREDVDMEKEGPLIRQLAEMALMKIDDIDDDLSKRKLLEVVGAQKQVVNGILYHLTIRVGVLPPCDEGEKDCGGDQGNLPALLCKVQVHQDVADTKGGQPVTRVMRSECEPQGSTEVQEAPERPDISTTPRTNKTQSRQRRATVGGRRPADTNDPYVQEMAHFALAELDRGSNALFTRQIVRVISAEKQVVAGIMNHLTLELAYSDCRKGASPNEVCSLQKDMDREICTASVWDRPWLKQKSVESFSCSPVAKETSREKREAPAVETVTQREQLLGGPRPANLSDPYILEMATFALAELDRTSDALFTRQVVKIISAETQVVAGSMTHLTLELGYSDCRKGDTSSGTCSLQDELDHEICTASVWDRPWLKLKSVEKFNCTAVVKETARDKREIPVPYPGLVGGRRNASITDPYVQDVAKFALSELDRVSNGVYTRQVVRIISVEQQTVAGTLHRITMEVAYSNCRHGELRKKNTCTLKADKDHETCTVAVLDQPWRNLKSVESFTCTVISQTSRTKRETPLLGRGTHDIHIGVFREFMARHGKQYSGNEEMRRRFHIFRANMRKVKVLQETEQGTAQYGPTQFADLTAEEFKQQYLGLNRDLQGKGKMRMKKAVVPSITLPPEFDWRHYNVVTPVKNQGSCGSCWAFSVTGNVEGQWALRRGQLLSLSEQELVDCDKLDEGCNGGLPSNAYESIQKLGGLETENDYPYEGRGETCHFNKGEVRATVTGALNITTNETQMAQWLVKNGPISIGINANAMQFYFGGVSHPWKMLCDPADLDHGVLIVGYGVHTYPLFNNTMPFWTIKNSWGPSWGEQGYYRVYRGDGTCGVNQMATSAIVG